MVLHRRLNPVLLVVALLVVMGCQQSITDQIKSQTDDPATIALAMYADALTLYTSAQKSYIPYQAVVKQTNPELDRDILEYFGKARLILNTWKEQGRPTPGDEAAFMRYIGQITLAIAKYIEERSS